MAKMYNHLFVPLDAMNHHTICELVDILTSIFAIRFKDRSKLLPKMFNFDAWLRDQIESIAKPDTSNK